MRDRVGRFSPRQGTDKAALPTDNALHTLVLHQIGELRTNMQQTARSDQNVCTGVLLFGFKNCGSAFV